MQKKSLTKILIAPTRHKKLPFYSKLALVTLFFVASSCGKKENKFHNLLNDKQIEQAEKQDHQFCYSLEKQFGHDVTSESQSYWRCRLSLAKYKLHSSPFSKEDFEYNKKINQLIAKISTKITVASSDSLLVENKKLDQKDHKKCLKMGFQFDKNDRVKVDNYLSCRESIISQRNSTPPFGDVKYLAYGNPSYNVSFILDMRSEEEIAKYNEAKRDYPKCAKFFSNETDFKNCVASWNKSQQCLKEIPQKKSEREVSQKITCQKESYLVFPNSFLKDTVDERKLSIEKTNANSDYLNRYNFAAIGIDKDKFRDNNQDNEKEKKENSKPDFKINSKEKLYSKHELNDLRQKYLLSCQKEVDEEIKQYESELKKGCDFLVNMNNQSGS